MKMVLSTNDVRKISGLPISTLKHWIEDGAVPIAHRGSVGPGNTHDFEWIAAIAAAYGARFLRAGFDGKTARDAARYVINLGAEGLRKVLMDANREGKNYVAVVPRPPDGGPPRLLCTELPDDAAEVMGLAYADLNQTFDEVMDAIEAL